MPAKKKASAISPKKRPHTGSPGDGRGKPVKKKNPSPTANGKVHSVKAQSRNRFAKKDADLKTIRPSGGRELSFFELVYEVARQIPYGRVTSYGAIAAVLGTKLSARVVGYAMNGADKINPFVPAHRVVNRVGLLSGKHHFKPPGKMEKLLKEEGVLVKDDTVVNFRQLFWDPGKEEDLGI